MRQETKRVLLQAQHSTIKEADVERDMKEVWPEVVVDVIKAARAEASAGLLVRGDLKGLVDLGMAFNGSRVVDLYVVDEESQQILRAQLAQGMLEGLAPQAKDEASLQLPPCSHLAAFCPSLQGSLSLSRSLARSLSRSLSLSLSLYSIWCAPGASSSLDDPPDPTLCGCQAPSVSLENKSRCYARQKIQPFQASGSGWWVCGYVHRDREGVWRGRERRRCAYVRARMRACVLVCVCVRARPCVVRVLCVERQPAREAGCVRAWLCLPVSACVSLSPSLPLSLSPSLSLSHFQRWV
jgi:hypothetical protein